MLLLLLSSLVSIITTVRWLWSTDIYIYICREEAHRTFKTMKETETREAMKETVWMCDCGKWRGKRQYRRRRYKQEMKNKSKSWLDFVFLVYRYIYIQNFLAKKKSLSRFWLMCVYYIINSMEDEDGRGDSRSRGGCQGKNVTLFYLV